MYGCLAFRTIPGEYLYNRHYISFMGYAIMSYIRKKKFKKAFKKKLENISGVSNNEGIDPWNTFVYNIYYYEVKCKREGEKVRQLHLRYLGKIPYGSQIGTTRRGIFNQRITHFDNVNGTELWLENDTRMITYGAVRESFKDATTLGQRNSLKLVEAYESDQPTTEYKGVHGSKKITVAGHYQDDRKTIRIFKQRDKDYIKDIMAHESAHNTFDRLDRQADKEFKDHYKLQQKEYDKAKMQYKKWDKKERELYEKYEALSYGERELKKGKDLKKQLEHAGDQVRHYNYVMATGGENKVEWDPVKHRHWLARDEFRKASQDEGGLTDYSRKYEKMGHINFLTENLAVSYEYFRYEYAVIDRIDGTISKSGVAIDYDFKSHQPVYATKESEWKQNSPHIEFLRKAYPKTYKAYKKIYEMDDKGDF